MQKRASARQSERGFQFVVVGFVPFISFDSIPSTTTAGGEVSSEGEFPLKSAPLPIHTPWSGEGRGTWRGGPLPFLKTENDNNLRKASHTKQPRQPVTLVPNPHQPRWYGGLAGKQGQPTESGLVLEPHAQCLLRDWPPENLQSGQAGLHRKVIFRAMLAKLHPMWAESFSSLFSGTWVHLLDNSDHQGLPRYPLLDLPQEACS